MALTFSEAFAAGAKAYKEGRKEGRSTRRNARLLRLASFRRLVAPSPDRSRVPTSSTRPETDALHYHQPHLGST